MNTKGDKYLQITEIVCKGPLDIFYFKMEKYTYERKEQKETRDCIMALSDAMPTGPYYPKYINDRNHRTV